MAILSDFSGLWGIGAVPSCLVPDCMIGKGGYWPSVRARQSRWGMVDSELVSLHMKIALEDKLYHPL